MIVDQELGLEAGVAGDESPADHTDVVIAGAGVGGAACALAFARLGARVLVLEQHKGPGNLNRGDSLLPTVTTYLQAWGVLDRFRAAGGQPLDRMTVCAQGKTLLDVPLRHTREAPYLVLAHPEIERTLVEAAEATGRVEVRYGTRVADLLREGERVVGVRVQRVGHVESEELRAGLVVGADGQSSRVRQALGIAFERDPYDHGYYGIALERPAGYEDAMRLELSPRGGVLVVPRAEPDLVGLGVLVQARDEALFKSGSIEDKLAAIRARSPLLADLAYIPEEGTHLYRLARAHAPRYSAAGAALIGDAIHTTNPVAGQGMTMAIEDAAALARRLGPVLVAGGSETELDAALRDYEAERRPQISAVLRWSHALAYAYARPGWLADTVRRRLFALGGTALGRRIHGAVYGRLATRPLPPEPRALPAPARAGA